MLNDAETRGEYLPCAPRIKWLNNQKIRACTREIVLSCVKEHLEHFLVQSSISKSNGNDVLDSFINIYAILRKFRESL